MAKDFQEKFWTKVVKTAGCWIWKGWTSNVRNKIHQSPGQDLL